MTKALVDFQIVELIESGFLSSKFYDLNKYVQPASIDLPIGEYAYLVKEKVLPHNKTIAEIISSSTIEKISLKNGAILLKGQTYLIPSININLNDTNFATTSPKSSIGRIDLMVRTIFDNSGLYDTIPKSTSCQIFLEVTPQSFNVKLSSGIALTQMMIFEESSDFVDLVCEEIVYDKNSNLLKNKIHKGALILSLNLGDSEFVGYEAISTNEVLDLDKLSFHDSNKYFRKIYSVDGKITLDKDRFYILTTKEKISIPHYLSAEMVPFSHIIGELRAHYAGFFDPGFGFFEGSDKNGLIGVLEVRPHETITIYDGQPICLMDFFKNKSLPKKPYGMAFNNYSNQQGPKLAKYFK